MVQQQVAGYSGAMDGVQAMLASTQEMASQLEILRTQHGELAR